jgi:hypothetical protein
MSSSGRAPIFILSCYRSGSTLMRYIFDTHPDVYSPPEVSLGDAATQLAHLEAGLLGFKLDPASLDQLPAESVAGIRADLGGRMDAATARHGKRLWCEKSPSNLASLGLLRLVFPEARFVCLYRHAFDVVQSLLKGMMHRLPELNPYLITHKVHQVSAALDYWNGRTLAQLAIEAKAPDRCVGVRYEDLVANPEESVRRVFSSLGLSWNEALLKEVFTAPHDQGRQDHLIVLTRSIHGESVGGGHDLPLDGVPPEVLSATRQLLKALGYPERPQPASRPTPADTPGTPSWTPHWLFETHLTERMRTEPASVKAIRSSVRFEILGDGGGTWVVDPQQRKVLTGQAPASCKIEISAADLFAVASGSLHPFKANEQGRLQFHGNINVYEIDALMRLLRLSSP